MKTWTPSEKKNFVVFLGFQTIPNIGQNYKTGAKFGKIIIFNQFCQILYVPKHDFLVTESKKFRKQTPPISGHSLPTELNWTEPFFFILAYIWYGLESQKTFNWVFSILLQFNPGLNKVVFHDVPVSEGKNKMMSERGIDFTSYLNLKISKRQTNYQGNT